MLSVARVVGAVLLSTTVFAGGVVAAGSAQAYEGGSCSIEVPHKVWVNAPVERIEGSLSDDCYDAGVDWAAWDVYHPREGWSSSFLFDGASTDRWDFYSRFDTLGTYSIEADGAWDSEYNDLYQNDDEISVKLGSGLKISTKRAGKKVTLKATATRYSPSADTYRGWSGAKVKFQYRTCAACSWKALRTKKANSKGKVSHTFTKSGKRYYRAVFSETSTTWGRTTGSKLI